MTAVTATPMNTGAAVPEGPPTSQPFVNAKIIATGTNVPGASLA